MIVYKKGDLLKSGAEILVHGCNCFCVMGAGVAQMIKHRWPRALEADKKFLTSGDHDKMGGYSASGTATSEDPLIINLYTQYGFDRGDRQLDYDALMTGMELLAGDLVKLDPDRALRVAMPMIGAGLAGGDWDIIELMINKAFEDRKVEVWIYDPAAN